MQMLNGPNFVTDNDEKYNCPSVFSKGILPGYLLNIQNFGMR